EQAINGILLCADGADIDHGFIWVGADARYSNGILVNVQADENRSIVRHADLRCGHAVGVIDDTPWRLWLIANPREKPTGGQHSVSGSHTVYAAITVDTCHVT